MLLLLLLPSAACSITQRRVSAANRQQIGRLVARHDGEKNAGVCGVVVVMVVRQKRSTTGVLRAGEMYTTLRLELASKAAGEGMSR
jgi:hypothetical protein